MTHQDKLLVVQIESRSAIRDRAGILVERGNVGRYLGQGATFLYAHVNAFLSRGAVDFADLVRRKRAAALRA